MSYVVLGQRASSSNGAPAEDPALDDVAVAECAAIDPEAWFALSNWAKQTANLQPWQRKLAYSAATRAREHLILAGTEAAIAASVIRPVARATGLRRRLWGNGARTPL